MFQFCFTDKFILIFILFNCKSAVFFAFFSADYLFLFFGLQDNIFISSVLFNLLSWGPFPEGLFVTLYFRPPFTRLRPVSLFCSKICKQEKRPLPSTKDNRFQNEAIKCTTILVKMSLICMIIKVIYISKAEHLTSFWYRGTGELGNGLFEQRSRASCEGTNTSEKRNSYSRPRNSACPRLKILQQKRDC